MERGFITLLLTHVHDIHIEIHIARLHLHDDDDIHRNHDGMSKWNTLSNHHYRAS